jgi:TatD DNase family protein
MKLIDTHAHLQFKAYDPDRDAVVGRNLKKLVAINNVGADLDSSKGAVKLVEKFDRLYASVGIHPHHAEKYYGTDDYLATLDGLAKQPKVVAIGEIGLDLHQYKEAPSPDLKKQSEIFHKQVALASRCNKPVILHCRDAYDELFDQVGRYKRKITGVVHCFMGSWEQAKEFLNLGLYISFTGNVTYKGNDYIREIAGKVPDDRIMVETDAPYLSPQECRGKRNEPIYVKMVAAQIAACRNLSLEETAATTTQNAKSLFKI